MHNAFILQVPGESYAIHAVAEQDAYMMAGKVQEQEQDAVANVTGRHNHCPSAVFATPMHKPGTRLAVSLAISSQMTMKQQCLHVRMKSATESFALTATRAANSSAHIMVRFTILSADVCCTFSSSPE